MTENKSGITADRDEWRAMTGYHGCCGMSRARGHHELCPRALLARAHTAAEGGE